MCQGPGLGIPGADSRKKNPFLTDSEAIIPQCSVYGRRLARIIPPLACALLGCALLRQEPDTGLDRLSGHAIRLKVPFERQAMPDLCGVAAVKMLAGFYQKPLSDGELAGLTEEARGTGGVSGASLKDALEEDGYFVAVFPGTLDRQLSGLYRQVDMGRPAIVMIGEHPRHYCVLTGYDETRSLLVLQDPGRGEVALDLDTFTRLWAESKRFTLLAFPRPPDSRSHAGTPVSGRSGPSSGP